MEEIRKFLQQRDIDVDSSDSDSDVSIENRTFHSTQPTHPENVDVSSNNKRKRNGSERLPTRRPDPNVYNRNALLARENRRKKKVYLESIEKELEEARNTNRSLERALKKQYKIAQRLEREKQYFKNILSNHAEINALVSALNFRSSPFGTASISPEGSIRSTTSYRCKRSRSSSSYEQDAISSNFESSENDYEPNTVPYDNTWNELLKENCFDFCEPRTSSPSPPSQLSGSNDSVDFTNNIDATLINDDHSYVKDSTTSNCSDNCELISSNTGVCLHITGGKLSLEFCPSCHWSANRMPPTQLLQEDTKSEHGLAPV